MPNDQDSTNPKFPTLGESMRDITGIIGNNPVISTSNTQMYNEKGKRVFRKFKDEKGVVSETDQSKSKKTVVTS